MDYPVTALCLAGLALVPIPPVNGKPTKAPRVNGWNKPKSANNPGGYSSNVDDFMTCYGFNFGLYHGASNTLALDLDDVNQAIEVFKNAASIDLTDYLNHPARFEIKSPKQNRGKLVFKLPIAFESTGLRQLKHNGKVIFELRSGNCQDVIHGQHPEGGNYQFIGNPWAIPKVPPALLDMLQHWEDWRPCLDSAIGIQQGTPKIVPQLPQQGQHPAGWLDPIQSFNQSYGVAEVLVRNGYKARGKDRFIRPGSESMAPGAAIMRNCSDGIERVFSHGGDCLNDGFAHDAFDCFRLLEHGGDFNQALKWSPEITKNNQK